MWQILSEELSNILRHKASKYGRVVRADGLLELEKVPKITRNPCSGLYPSAGKKHHHNSMVQEFRDLKGNVIFYDHATG